MNIDPGKCALSDPDTHIACGAPSVGSVFVAWPEYVIGTPKGFEAGIPVCQEHFNLVKGDAWGFSVGSDGSVSMIRESE